jgi:hypothetical protein
VSMDKTRKFIYGVLIDHNTTFSEDRFMKYHHVSYNNMIYIVLRSTGNIT